jgi:hypothetical protein
MFNPFRSLLIMQLEYTLQMLNVTKKFLELCLWAQPEPSKVTSSMLALVPVRASQPQDAPPPAARAIGYR